VKPGVIRSLATHLQGTVDNCKGAKAASKGVRDLGEGKALKGDSPGTVAARNKAVELGRRKNR